MDTREELSADAKLDDKLRNDYDFFLEYMGVNELTSDITRIKRLCDEYGYDFNDLMDSECKY